MHPLIGQPVTTADGRAAVIIQPPMGDRRLTTIQFDNGQAIVTPWSTLTLPETPHERTDRPTDSGPAATNR